jgi:putative ABC transport system permease protein
MIKNYFKIAWRNLLRNKLFSAIKILGLSIGLTVCMLIFLYTKDELTFDQFQENKGQLYRVIRDMHIGDQPEWRVVNTNEIVGETFAKEIPEVQQFVRIDGVTVTIKQENDVFTETSLVVDDNFLSVFTFPLIEGNKETALQDPHSVVITKDMAKKYFGTADVKGKTMQIKLDTAFEHFTISAVAENFPQNSTLQTRMLIPYEFYKKYNKNRGWMGGSLSTFLLLAAYADPKIVENKMQAIFDKNTKEHRERARAEQGISINAKLGLQAFTAIHSSTDDDAGNGMSGGRNPTYSYILTSIAVFILIVACINFINLAVAQSLRRGKEIGIRKVVGSTRKQLVQQFLVESFLVSLIAFAIAIILMLVTLPYFNDLANKKLSLSYLSDGYLYLGYFLLLLVTSLIAGFYPSLVLSSFRPVKVLYGRTKLIGKNYLTKGLVVLQFALAIFLIIGTIAVTSQLNFFQNADLGYDAKNLVRIDLPQYKSSDKIAALLANELLSQPNILSVAARNGGRTISGAKANGRQIEIEYCKISTGYLPMLKIPVIAGRNFSADFPSDTLESIIVNESFVKEAGWKIDETIGKRVHFGESGSSREVTVIGVVKDYHFLSLKDKITPEVFTMEPAFGFGELWVKIKPADIPHTLNRLQSTFKNIVSFYPYNYQFMDDINARNYEAETKWKQIISIASGLFIFISCIGLLGLVILSTHQRTKEIGIRKVLGAAVSGIILLISKDFIKLILIAFVIAAPVGYYFVNKWLQNFAYRIDVKWWIFALAGFLAVFIAFITIGFQAIKAAIANPVKSLRTE